MNRCEICGKTIPYNRRGKQELCPRCAYQIECQNMANDPDCGVDDVEVARNLADMWTPDEVE
jgi:hypothetical protein